MREYEIREYISFLRTIECDDIVSEDVRDIANDLANRLEAIIDFDINPFKVTSEEIGKLYTAVRTDLDEYEQHMKECEEIINKAK